MIQPIQIRFHHVRPDRPIISMIQRFADKLDRADPRITSCHVSIARPHRHRAAGNHYHVRIEIEVPGDTLVARRDPMVNALFQEPDRATLRKGVDIAADRKVLRLALHEAFDALTRQLRDTRHAAAAT